MIYPIGNGTKEDYETNWYSAQVYGTPTSYGLHDGCDFNLKTGGDTDLGQPIRMIANGQIVYYHYSSHPTSSFGRHLVYKIDGPWGTRWVHCAHLTDQDFKTSGNLTEGTLIGRVGKSGTSLAHLHFSVFKVDPVTFPQGIDNVANTTTELNQYWEDPLTFLNTWMSVPVVPPVTPPAPTVISDPSAKIDLGSDLGVMEVQAIRSTILDLRRNVTGLQAQADKLVEVKNVAAGIGPGIKKLETLLA